MWQRGSIGKFEAAYGLHLFIGFCGSEWQMNEGEA
jgi:hypothetical protein